MRTYSFFVSMLAHAALLGAAFAASIVATDVLPEPRRALEYITVRPSPPPPVPPPPQNLPDVSAATLTFTPLYAPTGISPEPPLLDLSPPDPSIVTGVTTGFVPTGVVEPPSPPPAVAPIRVGGSIQPPRKTVDVSPIYPAIARQARVRGVVILEAVIAEDGSVRNVRVLRSIPLLDDAAVDAVQQWRFTPTLLNGEAVPVVMTVTVAFELK
jgi:protein TonB